MFSEEQALTLPHVVICLFGKFKAEMGTDYHMMNVANVTTSGLMVRWWVEKLVEVCKNEGRAMGLAFADARGRMGSSHYIMMLHLEKLQGRCKPTSSQMILVSMSISAYRGHQGSLLKAGQNRLAFPPRSRMQ